MTLARIACCLAFLISSASGNARPSAVHHYVFFGQDRDALDTASAFIHTKGFEGAQIAYSWRQLEPEKDRYDFSPIREDLAFLRSNGKRLFVQLQDVTFTPSRINVPLYLQTEREYHGGASRQYHLEGESEERARVEGWMARRWDPAVQARLHKLFVALGAEFDGRIEGINLAETACEVGRSGRLFPEGFSFEIYRDAIIANMRALRRAFPTSIPMQYANFMPGEWLPDDDKGYLRAVYAAAQDLKVGVGGPDLLPFRRGQRNHSYPLIRAAASSVVTGIAVQEGNYDETNPNTHRRITPGELLGFATDYLRVRYIFWCTEEPHYSAQVVPLVARTRNPRSGGQ